MFQNSIQNVIDVFLIFARRVANVLADFTRILARSFPFAARALVYIPNAITYHSAHAACSAACLDGRDRYIYILRARPARPVVPSDIPPPWISRELDS